MKKDNKNSFAETVKKYKLPIICIGALVAVLVAIAVINSISTAYLRPYEKKYKVKYPRHIAEEFCDAYGIDTEVCGMLTFDDTDEKVYVTTDTYQNGNHFDSGSAIDDDKQIKSIGLESSATEIEKLYSSVKGYNNCSQTVTLTNIYGKSKTYQVIAAYYANMYSSDDNGYVFPYFAHGDLTEDSFNQYEDRVYCRSLYHPSYDMSYTDNYLSINVDTDFMKDFKFVILCVEVDGKVKPYTDAVKNKKIHYPQVWYDKHDKHNPYWLSSQWQPEVYTDKKHKTTEKM
ncbi:hypothetical protein [uncultured Eubacterium sp.]|uniref:hypothetical protein n=1 Tax=uncultured Eubacterium sp. TaxID=165185 RepID=UPI0026005127|nr:hypothetical protein [uncultured Eubacterium sp.]